MVLTDAGSESRRAPTLSERFEQSLIGEVLISVLVAAALVIAVVWNLPDSAIKSSAMPVLRPLATATGLEQVWQMYAPDPIHQLEYVDIHVTMSDGTERIWSFQRGDLILGPFTWYHIQKVKEQSIRDPDIRAGFARWAVRQVTQPGENPIHVQMIFRSQDLPPPGKTEPNGTHVETLYDEALGGRP